RQRQAAAPVLRLDQQRLGNGRLGDHEAEDRRRQGEAINAIGKLTGPLTHLVGLGDQAPLPVPPPQDVMLAQALDVAEFEAGRFRDAQRGADRFELAVGEDVQVVEGQPHRQWVADVQRDDVIEEDAARLQELPRLPGVDRQHRLADVACRQRGDAFRTYRRFWGLSAGDGSGAGGARLAYRSYSPAGPIDGTAHLTATLASAARHPAAVLENVRQALGDRALGAWGRNGLSSVNLDRGWVGPDMIGIDGGAAVLALDNLLMAGRVRAVFHQVGCVRAGCERLGFVLRASARTGWRATA